MPIKVFDFSILKAFTFTNFILNADFSNGTTNWGALNATISASNKKAFITGNGTSASATILQTTTIDCVANKKVFFKVKALVTNSSATSISANIRGSTTSGTVQSGAIITSPIQNQEYNQGIVFTVPANAVGKILVRFSHNYVDAATQNNKVMELQEVIGIDLTSLFGSGNEPSAADCTNIFRFVDGTRQPNFSNQIAT